MIGTGVLEARLEFAGFDFGGADRWHVLVLYDGAPAARVDLPSPGAVSGDALAVATMVRRADAERARRELIARLEQRLGMSPRPAPAPTVSVVVCTHRRTQYLADLIASFGRLDPAPLEVIVVDNDPGEEDARDRVEAAGLRYVREDRRGLDNGRNAGIRAARGDVVVFTDDDCVLSPGWLRPLARAFARESVAAVTGPAFPYLLDTPARVRMEHQASLARGLQRVSFDWREISPLHAAAMGVGANMAFRRSRLLELGPEPFPPELDAGTETESGGDSYVLGRLLAAGERVVYDPEMFVFHQHRPDGPALRRAVLGYGIGLSAALTKLVVEERELSAPRAWAWLPKQYLKTQRRRAVGKADPVETRLSWDYLRGGFLGSGRWRAALRTQRQAVLLRQGGEGAAEPLPVASPGPTAAAEVSIAEPAAEPSISVVIPTYRRPDALRRCLRALAGQDVAAGDFEVVVVDDDPDGSAAAAATASWPFALRRLRSSGAGAAAARNHGAGAAAAPLVLFLDDDIVADPWLIGRHVAWHAQRQQPAVLVGPYRPRPIGDNLAATAARLWWQDLFDLLAGSHGMTFVGALTANISVPRPVLDRVGGFSEDYSRQRREDWEWGLRVRRAGVPIEFDPGASARHEFTLGTAQRLRDARREGFGDTLIAAGYPEALASLPLPSLRVPTPRRPLRWLGFCLWRTATVQRLAVAFLDLLEAGRFREAWQWVFEHAQSASYAAGAHEGGWRPGHLEAIEPTPPLELELASTAPVPVPEVAAQPLRLTLSGKPVAEVFPVEGTWGPGLAEQIVDAMEPEDVLRAAALGGWRQAGEAHEHQLRAEVVFGPASPASDRAHAAELEAAGALVRVAAGEPGRHWEAVIAAAREGERPLLALPLPGTAPRPAWLEEALAAFDGERVRLSFGGALDPDTPAEPLYLHDRESADASLALAGRRPAYLVLRREMLAALEVASEMPGPVVAAIAAALEGGGVVGHRDTRGLGEPAYRPTELGEAFGRREVRTALGALAGGRRGTLARLAARGLLTLGWALLKGRGRLSPPRRQLAAGTVRGSVAELRRRCDRARPQA